MSGRCITHLMRAPIVGGSECETLTIVRALSRFRHRVVHPARFANLGPSLRSRFPADVPILAVDDVEAELSARPPDLLHVQFPFVLDPEPKGYDSVLELRALPPVRTLFTVHAAVNVLVVEGIDYLFHTERQYAAFADRIPRERVTIAGSLVVPPPRPAAGRGDGRVVVQWVSRNEDAKFHPELATICRAILDACPEVELRFVGRPTGEAAARLPRHPRLVAVDCPAEDLDAVYADADLFFAFPDPRLEETWGRTVTEALGHGLPCVVAAHGALSVQVRDGVHGRVVASPAECAAAIVDLVRDRRRRSAMAEAARARAVELYEDARAALTDCYARLLSPSPDHASPRVV